MKRRGRRSKQDFRFAGARLCFAFAGTLGDRGRPQPYERLTSPADLRRWCVESGCLATAPTATAADLDRARTLREAVQRGGQELAAGRRVARADAHIINAAAVLPPLVPHIAGTQVRHTGDGIDAVFSTVARDFMAVVADGRVHICANEACGIPFVDTSRAGERRWCSMTTCGDLAKKRTYRARLRSSPTRGDDEEEDGRARSNQRPQRSR